MKIEVAAHAGFCFGVKRSVDAVEALLRDGRAITTLGPVIHNPTVIESMKARGVVVVDEIEEITTNRKSRTRMKQKNVHSLSTCIWIQGYLFPYPTPATHSAQRPSLFATRPAIS